MNLVDVLDENFGLIKTGMSYAEGLKFGEEQQLKIIGWSGRQQTNNSRYYILFCDKCSKDQELFGDGYFKMTKYNLNSGRLPCGCATIPKWSKDQWYVLCKREAEDRGLIFSGFSGEWSGNTTNVKLTCVVHGEWESTVLASFMSGIGCPKCNGGVKKPDSEMVESFLRTGAFPEGTRFQRSSVRDKLNRKVFWEIYCPECKTTSLSSYSNLQQGKVPCRCKGFVQDQAYINFVYDLENLVALKFGISSNSLLRAAAINSQSCYRVVNHSVYKFPSPEAARKAENSCLQELECQIVLRRDLPDGYTETTWPTNLDKIIKIYETFGGELLKTNKMLEWHNEKENKNED